MRNSVLSCCLSSITNGSEETIAEKLLYVGYLFKERNGCLVLAKIFLRAKYRSQHLFSTCDREQRYLFCTLHSADVTKGALWMLLLGQIHQKQQQKIILLCNILLLLSWLQLCTIFLTNLFQKSLYRSMVPVFRSEQICVVVHQGSHQCLSDCTGHHLIHYDPQCLWKSKGIEKKY